MVRDPLENNDLNCPCPEKESMALAEKIAKFGCWECDLKTGQYSGSGYTQELFALTGKTCPFIEDMIPFIHPDDREALVERHRLQLEGQGYSIQFRVVADGKVRYLQSATEIFYNEEGRPIRSVGFVQDITEQKLQQQAREKSERQYRTLFHDACYAIWVMRPDGSFVECNQKAMEVYKADSEEKLFLHTFTSLAPSEQSEGVRSKQKAEKLIQDALKMGHKEFQWLAKDLDGKVFWTHVSLTKLSIDDQELLQVILRDIDEEKRSQIDLAESEAKYKNLFENAPFAAWILSSEGVFINCNSKAVEILHASDKETLRNLSPEDISPTYQPDGKKSSEQITELHRLIEEQEHHEFDWTHKRFDGTEFLAHVCINKVYIGGKMFIQALVQDIDEERRSQQLLQESEVKYRALFENASFAVAILSTEGVFVECNSRMVETLRLKDKESLINLTPLDVSPVNQPDGKASHEKMNECLRIVEERGLYDFDWLNRRFDGTEYWVHVFLAKMSVGGTDLIQVVIQDIDKEKRARKLLKESEAKYRNIFENAFFAIGILTSEGVLIDCNSEMPKLFHVENKESLINTTPADASPPYQPDGVPSAEKAKAIIETALEKGSCDHEWYNERFDGTQFWTHICLTKISIAGEDFVQVIMQDIDEAKRAQQQLKESEIRQKFIIKNIGLNMWIWDARTGNVSYTDEGSPVALSDFGKVDLPVDKIIARCHPDDHKKIHEFKDALLSGKLDLANVEFRFQSPEEKWVWLKTIGMIMERDRDGKPSIIIGCNQNIDQAKRAQEQLLESEKRKEFIIKNAGLSIWKWDLTTGMTDFIANRANLMDYLPDRQSIEKFLEGVHPDDRERVTEQAKDLAAGTRPNPEIEYRYRNPKGGWIWLQTNGLIDQRDENGKPIVAFGFHQNITERKLYEQRILEAKRKTEEANRAKSLFLANMSHEIRTPMTAILGYLDLMCDSDITPTERDEYAQTMRRNGIHLLDLINDILDLSKIEAGQIDVHFSYTQTVQLIDNVVGPLEALANEKGILLAVDYLSVIPEKIWTDPRLLRQILWNIIGNAVKFTSEGQVRIGIEYLTPMKGNRKKERGIETLKIRVQDTGCGIPKEQIEKIFEPFVQADSTATRQFGGTGLGLAIAQRQSQILKGTIRAWNNVMGGATFELTIPLEKNEGIELLQPENIVPLESEAKKEKRIAPVDLKGVTVLLAEDGMDNQRLISTVLRKAGAVVDIANNGQEAIEMLRAVSLEHYDVILMDMQMPLLDGYAATSRLREMKVDTPIIALTAHAMSGDRKKCLESGCDSYCTKPIAPKKLVALISRYAKSKLA